MFVYKAWTRTLFTWVALICTAYGIYGMVDGQYSLWWLVPAYFINQVFMLTMSVGNHRLFSHNGFKCHRFWHGFFAISSVLCGDDSSYSWAYIHRTHHRLSDKPNDPYDTHFRYFFRLKMRNAPIEIPHMKWMLRDPIHHYTHKYANLWILLFGAALLAVSVEAFLFCYMLPVAWHHLTGGLLIIFTHKNGEAIDRPWYWGLLLPSTGEWYHRAHHEPGKAKRLNNAQRSWQWDSGYWFCKLIADKGQVLK
jgi:stearoyl-CoA desaturase (delta-9 desaturase)